MLQIDIFNNTTAVITVLQHGLGLLLLHDVKTFWNRDKNLSVAISLLLGNERNTSTGKLQYRNQHDPNKNTTEQYIYKKQKKH